jgi:alpha/beta superfamily hydrolase
VVLAGQFLERPAVVDAGGLALEGLYHRGRRRPSVLVCPSPGPGGGMDAPAVAELAWAAARAGHASLRFQHRGVGASQGEPDPARALDDARAALRHLAESAPPPFAVAGHGAGCETAAAIAAEIDGCAGLALVAPLHAPAAIPPGLRVLAVLPEAGAAVDSRALEAALGRRGRIEVIAGADGLFLAGLPEVGRALVAFLDPDATR